MRINNSIVNNNFKKLDGKQIICGNNPEAFAFLTWLLKSPYTEDVFAASQTLLTFCIIYKWFRRVRGPAETQTKDVLCIGNPLVVSSYYFSNWFGFFYICIRSCSVRLRAVSLFSWSVEQNSRDTQMTTRVTEGVRALPILNLKKKRETAHSLVFCWSKMLLLILFCKLFDLFSKQWKFNSETSSISLHVTEVCSDLYLTLWLLVAHARLTESL